jgi:hypothetical protein
MGARLIRYDQPRRGFDEKAPLRVASFEADVVPYEYAELRVPTCEADHTQFSKAGNAVSNWDHGPDHESQEIFRPKLEPGWALPSASCAEERSFRSQVCHQDGWYSGRKNCDQ